jgi:hypothetical protein
MIQALPSKPTVKWIDESVLVTDKKPASLKKLKQVFGTEDF